MFAPAFRSDASSVGRFLRRVETVLLGCVTIYFLVGFMLGMQAAKFTVMAQEGLGNNRAADADSARLIYDLYRVAFEPANKPVRYVLPKRGIYTLFTTDKGTWYLDAAPAFAGVLADLLVVLGFTVLRLIVLAERPGLSDRPYEPPPIPKEKAYTEGVNLKMEAAASDVCGAAGTGRIAELLGALPADDDPDPRVAAVEEYRSALVEFVAGDPETAQRQAIRAFDLACAGYPAQHIAIAYPAELVGHCAVEAGDLATALHHYQLAAAIWKNHSQVPRYTAAVVALDGHGRSEIRAGRKAAGIAALARARALLARCGSAAQRAETARGHADFLRRNGLIAEADAIR